MPPINALKLTVTPAPPTLAEQTTMQTVQKFDFGFNTFCEQPLEAMLTACQAFCAGMQCNVTPYCLTLCGPSGVGKTLLARGVYRWFKQNLWQTQYVAWPNHLATRLSRFDEWPECVAKLQDGRFGLIEQLVEDWFQVIDDVGAEHDPRKFGINGLLRVLNGRQARKWTILTSNLLLADLAKLDTRIASRLLRDGNKVIECNAKDFNLRAP